MPAGRNSDAGRHDIAGFRSDCFRRWYYLKRKPTTGPAPSPSAAHGPHSGEKRCRTEEEAAKTNYQHRSEDQNGHNAGTPFFGASNSEAGHEFAPGAYWAETRNREVRRGGPLAPQSLRHACEKAGWSQPFHSRPRFLPGRDVGGGAGGERLIEPGPQRIRVG